MGKKGRTRDRNRGRTEEVRRRKKINRDAVASPAPAYGRIALFVCVLRVYPCPIVFHEISVCVPRGSDNSIATHNSEEQGALGALRYRRVWSRR